MWRMTASMNSCGLLPIRVGTDQTDDSALGTLIRSRLNTVMPEPETASLTISWICWIGFASERYSEAMISVDALGASATAFVPRSSTATSFPLIDTVSVDCFPMRTSIET